VLYRAIGAKIEMKLDEPKLIGLQLLEIVSKKDSSGLQWNG
jgi:hypothetical protein